MRHRSGLRLVPAEVGLGADWPGVDERSPSEPRLRILTVGEKAFGPDWRTALVSRAESMVGLRSVESVLDKLAVDHAQLALIGIAPQTGDEVLASIGAVDDRVRRRVVLVTPTTAGEFAKRVLRAGACDFVTTATPVAEVIVRLELRILEAYGVVLKGTRRQEMDVEFPQSVNRKGTETGDQPTPASLSPREECLFALFARSFGRTIGREEILRVVWQRAPDNGNPSNIVDVYVRYLRVKLERAAPHLEIVTVRDVGYRMCERRSR